MVLHQDSIFSKNFLSLSSNAFEYPSFINKSFKSLINSNFLLISDSNKSF